MLITMLISTSKELLSMGSSIIGSLGPSPIATLLWTLVIAAITTLLLVASDQRIHNPPSAHAPSSAVIGRAPSFARHRQPPGEKRKLPLARLKQAFTLARMAVSHGALVRRRSRLVADARGVKIKVGSKVAELRRGVTHRLGAPMPGQRLKQKFGHDLASRLDGRSSVRLQAHSSSKLFIDGSRRTQRAPFVSQRSTPALDGKKRPVSADAALEHLHLLEEPLDPAILPSEASPFDRLHVWLIDGTGLPHRPRWWPFEPYVLVTAVGEDTGSTAECPIGAVRDCVIACAIAWLHDCVIA